jgi:hypothetical protein
MFLFVAAKSETGNAAAVTPAAIALVKSRRLMICFKVVPPEF